MFTSEIKETIYLAISLILAAAVLGLVAFVLDIRSDFADVQNQEITSRNEMSAYAQYDKYQGSVLYGEDIIALIREYAGSDIAVSIDELVCKNGGTIKNIYIDKEEYLDNASMYSVYAMEFGKDDNGNAVYRGSGVGRDATYFAYLVFGKYTKEEIQDAGFLEMGYADIEGNPTYVNYSDVTGIKVIYLTNERLHRSEVENLISSKVPRG